MNERYPLTAFSDAHLTTPDTKIGRFPASRIHKGLIMRLGDRDLSEEGVGFGVPVLKLGHKHVFPGSWRMMAKGYNGLCLINADYEMNLVARMARRGRVIDSDLFCRVREIFSNIHRENSGLRSVISSSSGITRKIFNLEDVFEEIPSVGSVSASYLIGKSHIDVELRFPKIDGCTELIALNEQGASYFDVCRDSDGLNLKGDEIGSWDETEASEVSFIDPLDRLSFSLKKVDGARMFRGRELKARRLAWSGLAYVLQPGTERFVYSIKLTRI